MTFNIEQIQQALSDKELLQMLQANLNHLFPPEARKDPAIFLSELRGAPRGLRAMAATFDLDVSMAMDDLAWHFVNHPNAEIASETARALRELEATEAAEIFEAAFAIIEPHLLNLSELAESAASDAIHSWLDTQGIQKQIDPLNERLWKLLLQWPDTGLMHFWLAYARKYPEHCSYKQE